MMFPRTKFLVVFSVFICSCVIIIEAAPQNAVALRPLAGVPLWMQPDPPYMTRHGLCECYTNVCGCCAQFNVQQLNFNHQGCLNITYNPDDLAVSMSVLLSNVSIFQATLSGRNPPPLCIPVPQFPAITMCIKLHNVHVEDNNLFVCVNLELQLQGVPIIDFAFDCIKFGPNGLVIVKPDQLNSTATMSGIDFNFSQLLASVTNNNNKTTQENNIVKNDFNLLSSLTNSTDLPDSSEISNSTVLDLLEDNSSSTTIENLDTVNITTREASDTTPETVENFNEDFNSSQIHFTSEKVTENFNSSTLINSTLSETIEEDERENSDNNDTALIKSSTDSVELQINAIVPGISKMWAGLRDFFSRPFAGM